MRLGVPAVVTDWKMGPADGLEAAIAEFKAALPGWWYSVCECEVSADASCAPTRQSDHIRLVGTDERFDAGFHADLPQPAMLADALRQVMSEAQAAIAATLSHMDDDERRRFESGRRDWHNDDWQDHCGDLDCEQCGEPPMVDGQL